MERPARRQRRPHHQRLGQAPPADPATAQTPPALALAAVMVALAQAPAVPLLRSLFRSRRGRRARTRLRLLRRRLLILPLLRRQPVWLLLLLLPLLRRQRLVLRRPRRCRLPR
jgi:hypothetical protein